MKEEDRAKEEEKEREKELRRGPVVNMEEWGSQQLTFSRIFILFDCTRSSCVCVIINQAELIVIIHFVWWFSLRIFVIYQILIAAASPSSIIPDQHTAMLSILFRFLNIEIVINIREGTE